MLILKMINEKRKGVVCYSPLTLPFVGLISYGNDIFLNVIPDVLSVCP